MADGTDESVAQKVARGVAYKDEGNAAFARGDCAGALQAYHHAGLYLAGLDTDAMAVSLDEPRGGPHDALLPEHRRVLSLMAACYLKQARYERAITFCDQALTHDRANEKAIFRKAVALRLCGSLYQARDWLQSDAARAHAHAPAFAGELAALQDAIGAREARSARALRGFLQQPHA
ncbi:hypothetical protein MSPP1_001979 [Malassezia sp. CBS 17886]|nr:hypothetical protein MSPP1_001979 [Malassezia sp. CBS 17886]